MDNNLSYLVAFTAGLLTFFSPCFLPLMPSYIVYITGVSLDDLTKEGGALAARRKTIAHSLLFILGFSVVFVLLGLTATLLGKALAQYQKYIRIGGGILIILFGLQLMGILNLGFLMKERKFAFKKRGVSYLGSVLVGVTFAAAWTPCAGAILGSILVLAGTKADAAIGAQFLVAYSLGIAVPFFVSSLLMSYFLAYIKKAQKLIGAITYISGIFLILIGIAMATDYFQTMTIFLNKIIQN